MFIFIRHDIHLYLFIYHLNFLRVTFSKCLRMIQRMFLWLGNTLKWLGIHHLPNIFNSVIIVKSILQRFSVRHVLVIFVRNVKMRKRKKNDQKTSDCIFDIKQPRRGRSSVLYNTYKEEAGMLL